MNSRWIRLAAALALAVFVAALAPGCGHHSYSNDSTYYVVTTNNQQFTLTLVNHTGDILVPEVVVDPGNQVIHPPTIDPSTTEQVVLSEFPTSVTVSATALTSGTVYAGTTLDLGVDYFSNATGVTYIYR